ncbi:hypothetical protein GH721_09795 [Kriegella sp. EG-1]|nr:hypothetical protein [Flavobacteriaceae bacterium EG-1]
MRFLLISLVLLVVSCASYPKKKKFKQASKAKFEIENPYFANASLDYVYKADIKVLKKSFSGIFIVKKLNNQHHRIVFTTEMGNKLFDFEFLNETFKINHILPEMDKKILINILKHDFFALIKQNPFSEKQFFKGNSKMFQSELLKKNYYYFFENEKLNKIVRTYNGKEKVTFLFSGNSDNIVSRINIQHSNIKLNIYLKKL